MAISPPSQALLRAEGKYFAWYSVAFIMVFTALLAGWLSWTLNDVDQYYDPIPWPVRLESACLSMLVHALALSPLALLLGWFNWGFWRRCLQRRQGLLLICCSSFYTILAFSLLGGTLIILLFVHPNPRDLHLENFFWYPLLGIMGLCVAGLAIALYWLWLRPAKYHNRLHS